MKKGIVETCSGLQSLLDDCAFHGATLDACTCADFEQSGDCEHVDTLHTFKDFYSTNFHHIKRNGVTVNAYRVLKHVVIEKMIDVPTVAPQKLRDYKTSMTACQCPDFTHRGGSYIRNGHKVCKHMAHLIDDAMPLAV